MTKKFITPLLLAAFISTMTLSNGGSNPYRYHCASNNDCVNNLNNCVTNGGPAQDKWFCDCRCTSVQNPESCRMNEDCCNSLCINGFCANNGGEQGAQCGGNCFQQFGAQCAPGYICQPWGDHGYGYCDSTGIDCTGKSDGNYADPNKPCSQTYYTCANGIRYVQTCQNNLYFDQQENECLEESLVPSCA